MLKTAEELGLINKASVTAIIATVSNTVASSWGWINENMAAMSGAATFVLTIVMVFSYILGEIRKNRELRINTIQKELEIEAHRIDSIKKELN